jgi:hypothetical protein
MFSVSDGVERILLMVMVVERGDGTATWTFSDINVLQ